MHMIKGIQQKLCLCISELFSKFSRFPEVSHTSFSRGRDVYPDPHCLEFQMNTPERIRKRILQIFVVNRPKF